MEIKGAVALVTGGARGIGRAIAYHLHNVGATVIVADRDAEALIALPSSLIGQIVDVTQLDDTKSIAVNITRKYGKIDILINNAGVIYSEPMVNLANQKNIIHTYDKFKEILVANLDSVFIMTSAVLEQMVMCRTQGIIINISSISARGNEGQTAYAAAKAAINAMTVTWAKEFGRWGIRCNAIAPGFIDTASTRKSLSETAIQHIQANTPLRRLGKVDEVAKAVCSLIENDFINGVVLDVNGGLSI